MKRKLIAIICVIALLLSASALSVSALGSWTTYSTPTDIDYSFVAFGDMQSMTWTDNKQGTTYVKSVFDWIINNKDSRNIEYVFGLGDTIDTLTTYSTNVIEANGKTQNVNEWIVASTQIHRLDGVIPYSIIRGNHDDEGGYHKYICTEDYKNQMTGFYYDSSKPATLGNSMSNSYRKIIIGGQKYLMLSLDYHADDAVIEWANNVVAANPSYRVIASVHVYLNGSGNSFLGFFNEDVGSSNVDNTELVYRSFSGEYFWDNLFSKHANMFMVLCGHDALTNPVHNTRIGDNGNKVIELLIDTSKYDVEFDNCYGATFAMVLNFREDTNELQLEYLSPSRIAAGYSNHHLSGEQISFTYEDLPDLDEIDPDISLPTTNETASARISTDHSGLRFKTNVLTADIELLRERYTDVKVGTLIMPTDKLGDKMLTHDIGVSGVDYIDVVADIDKPFATDGTYSTYAGTISNIKIKNLNRNFTAVGYISYVDQGGATVYAYSTATATRNVDFVAEAALADKSANYSAEAKAILEKLTYEYYGDPFVQDPFAPKA